MGHFKCIILVTEHRKLASSKTFCFITDGKKTGCSLELTRIENSFVGTGDLFAALVLVWLHKHPDNLQVREILVFYIVNKTPEMKGSHFTTLKPQRIGWNHVAIKLHFHVR